MLFDITGYLLAGHSRNKDGAFLFQSTNAERLWPFSAKGTVHLLGCVLLGGRTSLAAPQPSRVSHHCSQQDLKLLSTSNPYSMENKARYFNARRF